jgi:hypothetical protein
LRTCMSWVVPLQLTTLDSNIQVVYCRPARTLAHGQFDPADN